MTTLTDNTNTEETKKRLLAAVKKEVKQLMEEAVTRKFVHEESGTVTSLCAAVEACLGQGLRRRALGLFKTSSTTALLHKVAKHCEEAAVISQRVLEAENGDPNKRSSSSGDSTNKGPIPSPQPPTLSKKNSASSILAAMNGSNNCGQVKYLWIRLALYEKQLARIIDHLARHASRYYERDALVADPDYGYILSSLLVGPCALEYSHSKTPDHFWTDPPADELVQRHRISSGHPTPPPCRRPMLNFKRSLNTHSSEEGHTGHARVSPQIHCAKDYVESLHQNSRATLLYGKNNVKVLPKDVIQPMPGYLSLHQSAQSLTIKWTPNQLMNGYSESDVQDKSSYWDYALNINVDDIVYLHCHQGGDKPDGNDSSLILVGQDGVQRPPIIFPAGGHLASFLSCLETGLLPHGQLDPPLWSARGSGKILPRPPKLRRRPLPSVNESHDEPSDYVFRIYSKTNHEDFMSRHELLDRTIIGRPASRTERGPLSSCSTASSESSSKSLSLDNNESPMVAQQETTSLALVCSTMKRQIISRAFYGWLAYCRHLSTVRTHLSGLVQLNITSSDGAEEGLTTKKWEELHEDGVIVDFEEVYRLVYWGGVEHEIRKEVWPYLLGHYKFGSTPEERSALDAATRQTYETSMSEWLAVEAIVRQRDKEQTAASIARLGSESTSDKDGRGKESGDVNPNLRDGSNDVFEDCCSLSDEEATCLDANHHDDAGRLNYQDTISVPDTPAHQSLDLHHSENDEKPENDENGHIDATEETDAIETESAGSRADQFMTPEEEAAFEKLEDFDYLERKRSAENTESVIRRASEKIHSVIVTNPSVDVSGLSPICDRKNSNGTNLDPLSEEQTNLEPNDASRSNCASPVSSNGGVYSMELLDTFGLNLHRIDKDVQRCDRNYWYFSEPNLDKLRNVMCTYVWANLDIGYMQGMCDLAAPLLVILDDESKTHACFRLLMERMIDNFPNGGAMDAHFANMRSLIQILDAEMFELMHAHGDYTHFYFCYRWFLLDFKRELLYRDVFYTWEVIWAARHVASSHLVLFLALAFLETYRDIILSNSMDFTDIIKFFNEMAERHNAKAVLDLARDLVLQLQTLMENK